MFFKTTLDPVGKVAAVPGLSDLVEKMKEAWTKIKEEVGANKAVAINFLTRCLDSLVVYLVEHEIPGQDKKATVLEAFSKIYDWVVVNILPIYLRPFSKLVKVFVINVLVSNAIDWIVEKYNNGSWHPQATTEVFNLWGVPGDHRPK